MFDSLFTIIVIVLLSAASSWLSKRRENPAEEVWQEEEDVRKAREAASDERARQGVPPKLPSEQRAPQPPPTWEEKLRRMLEGAPSSPPVLAPSPSKPASRPEASPAAPPYRRPMPAETRSPRPHSTAKDAARQTSENLKKVQKKLTDSVARTSSRRDAQGGDLLSQARALREAVKSRASGMLKKPEQAQIQVVTVLPGRTLKPTALQTARTMIQGSGGLRQAVVVAEILNPPRALTLLSPGRGVHEHSAGTFEALPGRPKANRS